jgi:predicted MFS family arabinose efflux permease
VRSLAPSTPNRRAALAVAIVFFVNGATFSNWVPRIPEVRDRLGVSNAGLGAALVGGGIGGLLGTMLTARVQRRLSTRGTVRVSATLLACGLPVLALAGTPVALAVTLVAMTTLDVLSDLAMNAQGVTVEDRIGRSIMNRLHACWSIGALTGASVASVAAAFDVSITAHFSAAALVLVATSAVASRWFLDDPPVVVEATAVRRSPRIALQRAALVVMGAGAAAAVIEMVGSEWSAIALSDLFDLGAGAVGLGPTVFALAMVVGRLTGDHLLDRLGRTRLLAIALVLVSAGMLAVVAAPVAVAAVCGFGLWGLGTSVLFPQLYAMAGRLPGTPAAVGLSSMVFGQRAAFIVTPLAVGTISDQSTMRVAIAVLVGGALVALALSSRRLA